MANLVLVVITFIAVRVVPDVASRRNVSGDAHHQSQRISGAVALLGTLLVNNVTVQLVLRVLDPLEDLYSLPYHELGRIEHRNHGPP